MFKQTENTNCCININNKKFFLHKDFLSDKSIVFANLLNESVNIIINDVNEKDFLVILNYIYNKNIKLITEENIFRILFLSNKYDIKDLQDFCLEYIKKSGSINIDIIDNLWHIFKTVDITTIIQNTLGNLQVKNLFTSINSLKNNELKIKIFSIIDKNRDYTLLNRFNENLFNQIKSIII